MAPASACKPFSRPMSDPRVLTYYLAPSPAREGFEWAEAYCPHDREQTLSAIERESGHRRYETQTRPDTCFPRIVSPATTGLSSGDGAVVALGRDSCRPRGLACLSGFCG